MEIKVTLIVFIMLAAAGCAGKGGVRQRPAHTSEAIRATVHFGFNRADISKEARQTLDDAAAKIAKNPTARTIIEGHTDLVGSDYYNDILAEKRARSVGAYLMQAGADFMKLTFISKGKREPIVAAKGRLANKRNRRVEIYSSINGKDPR